MNRLFYVTLLILVLFSADSYSQEDTITVPEDTTQTVETDPVKIEVSRIIKEVNTRAAEIDNIISTGEIK